MSDFYNLEVQAVQEEIGGQAKSVTFKVPSRLQSVFTWKAGQHLTLQFHLQGEEVRRSYTISSPPDSCDPLRITVKRVKGGLVSNHINDQVKAGDTLRVMPPFGSFFLEPKENHQRTHYFFGAGSGITPLFSMISTVLNAEPHSVCHLLYGNKAEKSIIFNERLSKLQENHGKKLSVHHVLSTPSIWSSFKPWAQGKVNKKTIEELIREKPPYAQDTQYYICGPGSMNRDIKQALMGLDVPSERIHSESFGGTVEQDDSVQGVKAQAHVKLKGEEHRFEIQAGETILEAARKAGLKPPYSCQSGVCGACRCELKSGSAHLRSRMALDEHEVDSGILLSCQALPTTETISVSWT